MEISGRSVSDGDAKIGRWVRGGLTHEDDVVAGALPKGQYGFAAVVGRVDEAVVSLPHVRLQESEVDLVVVHQKDSRRQLRLRRVVLGTFGVFRRVSARSGFATPADGRGMAGVDFGDQGNGLAPGQVAFFWSPCHHLDTRYCFGDGWKRVTGGFFFIFLAFCEIYTGRHLGVGTVSISLHLAVPDDIDRGFIAVDCDGNMLKVWNDTSDARIISRLHVLSFDLRGCCLLHRILEFIETTAYSSR